MLGSVRDTEVVLRVSDMVAVDTMRDWKNRSLGGSARAGSEVQIRRPVSEVFLR